MRHLDDLEEYKSYAVQELSTFRAWCKKWTNDCIVLLVYFSLEVLAPARLLSKSFQDEDMGIITSESSIYKAKLRLARIVK